MTNNDVIRRLRYTFQLRDKKVVNIFSLANRQVTEQQVVSWLKPDEDEAFMPISDTELASFLNGFIVEKRGRSDRGVPAPEKELTKNLILKKLKIALNLQSEEIVELLAKQGVNIGNAELTAFFRKPEHKNYRHCKGQFLRNFLAAIQDKYYQAPTTKKQSFQRKPQTVDKHATAPKEKTPTPKKRFDNPYASFEEKKTDRKVLKLKPKK